MPFVRFSRDKRGYEHVYLLESGIRRGKPFPAKMLYWFRTPPGVKIGREPFDEETRRSLETQYPNLIFDWKKITSAQIPAPEAESWREKRRVARAVRQARVAEEHAVDGEASEEPGVETSQDGAPDQHAAEADAMPASAAASAPAAAGEGQGPKRRRRRRGGRGRQRPAFAGPPDAAQDPPIASTNPPTTSTLDPHEEE